MLAPSMTLGVSFVIENHPPTAMMPDKEVELDNFSRVGTMLSILKSLARKLLKSRRRAS